MKISDFFDMKVLVEILTDWSKATGIGVIAIDEKGEYITDPIGWKDFCMKYTRGSKEGLRRCVQCDRDGQGVYFCHAGLMDFTADIKVGDHYIGKLIGGQVLPHEPDEQHFRELAGELGINPEEYLEALKGITVMSEESIRAAAKLLEEVVNIVVNSQYVKKKDDDLLAIFDGEIDKAANLIHEINDKSCELDKIEGRQRILGLNASIEAARAGEFGKGFSVVAKEVGDLANSSGTINRSIKSSLENLTIVIDHMEESKGRTDNGNEKE